MSEARTGVWDTVLEFGRYQHATVDGEPTVTVFDATSVKPLLDDFAQHPDSDIFYDKQHEVVEAMGEDALDPEKMKAWGDGHALAWGSALAMVVGGRVVRYEAHPGAPEEMPFAADIERDVRKPLEDGVYVYRSEVTPLGAAADGLPAFRYTSPYFVGHDDGFRLLNLTATNDPRMRGAALAYERGRRVAMKRIEMARFRVNLNGQQVQGPFSSKQEAQAWLDRVRAANDGKPASAWVERQDDETKDWFQMENNMDQELMARAGCMESDSPEDKFKKMSAYAAKMEAEKAEGEKAAEEMRRKMEANPAQGKETPAEEKAEKEAMQAMSRDLAGLRERNEVLAAAVAEQKAQREAMARDLAALKADRAEKLKTEAQDKAQRAIAMGRVKETHKGDYTRTVEWLAGKFEQGDAVAEELLQEEGTFRVSERVALSRLTVNGSGKGAPSPREGAEQHPATVWEQKVAEVQKTDKIASFEAAERVAMQRHPRAYEAYRKNPTMARA